MLVVSFLFCAIPVSATAPIEPPLSTKEDMVDYATQQALNAQISPSVVLAVISCESQWNPVAIGDHGQSHGLVQIHSPSHRDISIEQANDPKFAIGYLVSNLRDGNYLPVPHMLTEFSSATVSLSGE